jgi:tetratricopeptide (TPR) repeat protein
VFADFVGAAACAQCHPAAYDAWRASVHGRAGGAPTRERVIAPFNGEPIRFRDALVTPTIADDGSFTFRVAQRNRPALTFRVAAVVGGGFMAGGGTQTFFTPAPDGTLRYLPFDYTRHERRWFCPPRELTRGWVPITADVALAECGDWPPHRILGSSERFPSCQQCHGSQIEVALDTATRRYTTRYATLAIDCESCHGPARRHVELARSGSAAARGDVGMPSLATLTKDQSLEVCFQCHAVKAMLDPGYLPGKRLSDHFALKLPQLLDGIYHPDGRTRAFGYQEGHLASDCYLNGSMTCVDCHDPHTQRYRDVVGTPLPGRFADGQCLGCHPSKAEPVERHTHHRAASPGSRCVACHMPYLQHPNVGERIRYARSDHTISIPRPAFDQRLGIESACRQCHRERAVSELQARVVEWFGELKPHPPAVAALLAARDTSDAAVAARTILAAAERHPLAEVAGLAHVLERYASPDMAALDGFAREPLERLAASPDRDVQALALATLHLARGADPRVRRFLARQLRELGPRDAPVRRRWVWVLRVRGNAYLAGGDLARALAAYGRAEEIAPHDPAIQRSLGVTYTRLRDFPRAVEHLRQGLTAAPDDAQALVGLGFALMQQGDVDGAIAAHGRAVAVSPWDPAGYANLGVAHLRRGELQPAIAALERAVELDPRLATAHFTLAEAYARTQRPDDAAAALERGLEFDPGNALARRMLESLRR